MQHWEGARMHRIPSIFGFLTLCFLALASDSAPFNTARIEEITGLKGSYHAAERVFKVSAPRADIKVAVDSWTMPPFMGLTSWAAFTPGKKDGLMVMGDLVVLQDE